MKSITPEDKRQAYMKYVIAYLKSNMQVITERGFFTFNSFIEREANFKYFAKRDPATQKNFKLAFNQKRIPEIKTLDSIYEAFNLPISFGKFEYELEKNNNVYTKYLYDDKPSFMRINIELSLFSKIPKNIHISINADKFYNGYPPTWGDLKAEFDFNRSIYSDKGGIKEIINNIISQLSSLKFLIIKGIAGTGKTTLLKRITYDLSKSLGEVYYVDTADENRKDLNNIFTEINTIIKYSTKKTVFIINNFYNIVKPNDSLQLRRIVDLYSDRKVLFILTEHNLKYNDLHHDGLLVPEHLRITVELKQLDDNEIDRIFEKIESLEHDGKLTKIHRELSVEQIKGLCKEKFGRQMLVALLQIRIGKRFPEIIREECSSLEQVDISKFSYYSYGIVCMFHTLGVQIYDDIIFHSLNKDWREGINNLWRYCSGMIIDKRGWLLPRHNVISEQVFKIFYEGNQSLILNTLISLFDLQYYKEANDKEFFSFLSQFFSTKRIHQKLLAVLNFDNDSTREFYLHFIDFLKSDKLFRQIFLASYGLFEKSVANYNKAIEIFHEIIRLNNKNGFAYRMLTYTYLDVQDWEASAKYALLSFEFSRNDEDRLEAAKILSYNKYYNFLKAEPLFKVLKNSKDAKIKNECDKYFSCLEEIKTLKISDDDTIQKFILERIRPKLIHLSAFISAATQNYKIDVYELLVNQQELFSAEYDELNSVRNEFENIEDVNIKGLYFRLLAGALKRKFDNMEDYIPPELIENLFLRSLTLNNSDAFTHNFFGTFLKDIKEDYIAAEKEYRDAIEIGDSAKNEFYHRHPKFLNDLALLIVKQVERGFKDKMDLLEAKALLEEAIIRVGDLRLNFNFPEENLKHVLSLLN